jgi:hypothetical protein
LLGYRFLNPEGLASIDFLGGRGRGLRLLAEASQAELRIFYRTEQNIIDKIFLIS